MITVKNQATIAGISELRSDSEKILAHLKENRVILERHKRPIAVMLDYDQFSKFEEMIELAEDIVLAAKAHERIQKAKKSDFVDLDQW